MKLAILSLLVGTAVAFTSQSAPRLSTSLRDAMADLEAIAEKSNPVLKVSTTVLATEEHVRIDHPHCHSLSIVDTCIQFYDPLQLSSITIYDNTNDQSIMWLRQSEIKHGRIAMAAFVGYIVQSNGIRFPWAMTMDGTPFPSSSLLPNSGMLFPMEGVFVVGCFCFTTHNIAGYSYKSFSLLAFWNGGRKRQVHIT